MRYLESLFGEQYYILKDPNYQLLLAANVFAVLGVAVVSPILGDMSKSIEVSAIDMGLMISLFTGPTVIAIPLAGAVGDALGRKPVITAGLLLFGLAGTAIAFTDSFRLILGLRFLQGVGFAAIVPTIIISIGDLYGGVEEATGQGLRITTSGISQSFFPLVAGFLVAFSWRYPFLLYFICIPVAVIVHRLLEEPRRHTERSAHSRLTIGALRDVFTRRTIAVFVGLDLSVMVWTAFLTYNSILVVNIMEGPSQQAGLFVSVYSLSFAITASQSGRLMAFFEGQWYPLLAAHTLLGAGLMIFSFSGSFAGLALGTLLTGLGAGITASLYRSTITSIGPEKTRGSVVSGGEASSRLAATLIPIVMSVLIAAVQPYTGFEMAVRWVTLSVGALGWFGGIVSLLFAMKL